MLNLSEVESLDFVQVLGGPGCVPRCERAHMNPRIGPLLENFTPRPQARYVLAP